MNHFPTTRFRFSELAFKPVFGIECHLMTREVLRNERTVGAHTFQTFSIGCCHSPRTDNWPTPGVHLQTDVLFALLISLLLMSTAGD